MFLVNSRQGHFSAASHPKVRRHPFSRSYGVNLPSSLATNHPSALVFSTTLPVSVCGTGTYCHTLEVFLGSLLRGTIPRPEGLGYCQVSALEADLPTSFNAYALQRGISVPARPLRFSVTPSDNSRWYRNIYRFAIDYPFRVRLRSRLTPFRLALNGKP